MIEFKNVCKKYDNSLVLDNISFKLPNKGIVYLKGKSGSGKSTILNLIAKIDKPTSGEILYNGINIDLIKHYQSLISYIPTENSLISFLNVKDNILFSSNKDIDKEVLNKLNINSMLDKKIDELSGGETKRTDIIKSIFNEQPIILLDEPFNSLDKENNDIILDVIKKIGKDKLVIVTSHINSKLSDISDIVIEIQDNSVKLTIKNTDIYEKCLEFKIVKKKKKINFLVNKLLFYNVKKILSYFIILLILFSSILILANVSETRESINSKLLIKNKVNITYIYDDVEEHKVYSNDNFRLNVDTETNIPLYYQNVKNNIYLSNISNFKNLDNLVGRLPQNKNEIVISEYLEECLIYFNFIAENSALNKELEFNDITYKIVGIYKQNLNKFNSLKNIFELNQNNRIIDLYNMLYNGIITKNIIYFNAEFINNLDNKYNEYSAINSNNYFKLKNIIKNYHTIDMYSNIVDNNLNTYKLITNISYPLLVLLSIIVILVICYIINNIKEEYYSDFNKLKYYSFTRKDLNKIFSKYMIIIVLSSVLTSLLISYFVIDVLNSYLIMCNNLIADIFIYNYFYLFILVVLIIILIKLVVLLLNKK